MSPRYPTSDPRTRTLLISTLVLAALIVVAGVLRVPLVVLDPGPTYNTLGEVGGQAVVTVTGRPVYPTTGHLDMTTVRLADDLNGLAALEAWLNPGEELIPRSAIYPPGKSAMQVQHDNAEQFNKSENDAEVAALSYLNQPLKVIVGPLTRDAPAAGVLKEGDQLLEVKGQRITSPAQVSQILRETRPGDEVPVGYQRADAPEVRTTVRVGTRPDGPQGFLGITPEGRPLDPHQIRISLADVGGPSAGLVFALAVVDKITPDDLTGGLFVAGTGEIYPTGLVGPIGGITLKMIGAREAGATVFLTPAANCAEAVGHVPDGLRLVKVNSLSDAVDSITALKQGRQAPGC